MTASIKLLERTGFTREGLARRYLKINGVWQDHLLYALLEGDCAARRFDGERRQDLRGNGPLGNRGGKVRGWRASERLAWLALAFCLVVCLSPVPRTRSSRSSSNPSKTNSTSPRSASCMRARGDRLQIDTAAGQRRIYRPHGGAGDDPRHRPGWLVFALTNPGTERISRWLVAPRYMLANSRVFWPELDAGRIATITPSLGFRPERMRSDRADMFRLSLEPGQTITFAAEMASREVPRLTLWDPESTRPSSRTACCSRACCSASPACSPFS